ncbi:MAG: hypothetical protein AAGC58_07950 [Asticcacaulis sp.]
MTSTSLQENQTFPLRWQGIDLTIQYCPCYLGLPMCHIEVQSTGRQPLPITETGYRSYFLPWEDVPEADGPAAFVLAWLDSAAQSSEWRAYQEAQRQLSLF